MILPIGHEESTVRRLPWVTLAVMGTCVVALLLTNGATPESGEHPYVRWGFTPEHPHALRLVTHIFMHAGWLHLIGNLFMLFLAGPPIEDRYGRPLFALFFLLSGSFSALFYGLLTHHPELPLVGASGAIAGVLGAFLIRFWSSRIRFFYLFFLGFRVSSGTFDAPAYLMLPLWFAGELLQGWLAHSQGLAGGVAYWAHVGGFLFGAGVALAIRQLHLEERYLHSAIEAKVTFATGNPVLEVALQAREQGDAARAYELLQEEVARHPEDPDVGLAFWDAAAACQRAEESAPAFAALIRRVARGGDLVLAARYWVEMTALVPTALCDPQTLLRVFPILRSQEPREQQIQALRHAVDPRQATQSAGVAMRVVELAREVDPPTALLAARRALAFSELHEAKRAKLEALVAELESSGVAEPPADAVPEPATAAAGWERQDAIALEADGGDDLSRDPRRAQASQIETAGLVAGAAIAAPAVALSLEGGLLRDAAPPELTPPPLAAPPPLPDAEAPASGGGPPPLPGRARVPAAAELPRFNGLKVVEAVPSSLDGDLLRMQSGGRRAKLELARVDAVAVGAVRGLAARPIVVIDLALGWRELGDGPLRVLRLRSDGFDPRALAPGVAEPGAALRAFLSELLRRSGATALPDPDAARGRPFRVFPDLASYEGEVLQVG
jgi:membrane associated rhomboid family serine protease